MSRLATGAAVLAGLALAAAPATPAAAAMDYYQYHDTYASQEACDAAAQPWLWPTHPAGADGYLCDPEDGAWDLYLIFAT